MRRTLVGTILITCMTWACSTRPPTVFVLPTDFHGWVVVEYDVDDGDEPELAEGCEVVVIPTNGVVRLSTPLRIGYAFDRYYMGSVDEDNRLVEDFYNPSSGFAVRNIGQMQIGNDRMFILFYVGTREQYESSDHSEPERMASSE